MSSGAGPWKDSGLGQAFQSALASPDNITYIDWQPYGPSAGADAAFLATGLRNEDGVLIGIYSIQLPPEYEKSIELLQPQCTFEAITDAFEGSVNVVGLGGPTTEYLEKPLPCFKGYSPVSFMSLLDRHFVTGYPEGNPSTQVPDPYFDIKAHAVDGVCAIAFAIQNLLQQGYTVAQIQQPNNVVYERMSNFIRNDVDFQGVSGQMKFNGNDKSNPLAIQQVQSGSYMQVGAVSPGVNQSITWVGNGTTSTPWQVEPAKVLELMWLLHPLMISLAICCPCMIGCYVGFRLRQSWRKKEELTS